MEGSLNLAALSEYDAVLDGYGQLFEDSLREKGQTQVEFCSATSSQALVQKFNEILSDLTLNQALQKQNKETLRRYLIFRDSILMQDFELQLLARLVNGFPAGNISVILLVNSTAAARSKLSAFGKNLLQWEVETRAGERRQLAQGWQDTISGAAMDEPVLDERLAGEQVPELNESDRLDWLDPSDPTPMKEADVSKILNMPKKTAWRVPSFGFTKPSSSRQDDSTSRESSTLPVVSSPAVFPATQAQDTLAQKNQLNETVLNSPAVYPPAEIPTQRPISVAAESSSSAMDTAAASVVATSESAHPVFLPPKRGLPWWPVILLLLASASASAYLYRETLLGQAQNWTKEWLKGTPAPATAADLAASQMHAQASDAIAAAQAQVDASAALAAASSASAAASAISVASQTQSNASQAVSAASTAAAVAPASASVAPPVSSVASVSVVAPVKTVASSEKPLPPSTKASSAGVDQNWLEQISPTEWVLQLAAFDSEDEAREYKNSERAYAKARILSPLKKGTHKHYFIVVMGPFDNKAEADKFLEKNPLYARGWLRSGKSVKAQFDQSKDGR
jgi:septal ring-binding cell division protein DamX